MSYNVITARYANPENTAAILETVEVGAVLISAQDTPDLWAQLFATTQPESYTAPVPPVPTVVSIRQARLALLDFGMLDSVEAAVAAGDRAGQIEWEFASEVVRSSPMVINMANSLNLTESDLDSLFMLAASK